MFNNLNPFETDNNVSLDDALDEIGQASQKTRKGSLLPAKTVEVLELKALTDPATLKELFQDSEELIQVQYLELQKFKSIENADKFETAGKTLNGAKKLVQAVDEQRKRITDPILAVKTLIHDFAKELVLNLQSEINLVTKARNDYAKEEDRKLKEAQAKIETEKQERLAMLERMKPKPGHEEDLENEKLMVQIQSQAKEQELMMNTTKLKGVTNPYKARIFGAKFKVMLKLFSHYLGSGGDWAKMEDLLLRHYEKNPSKKPIDGVELIEEIKTIAR